MGGFNHLLHISLLHNFGKQSIICNYINTKTVVQVRWNYKLKPNTEQETLMAEWLVTLRKHRNYCLKERENGWNDNNRDSEQSIIYAYGSYCDIDTRNEWGSCSPLTCPVVKHGVTSAELTKLSKDVLKWGNASDIQMKRTTQLRHENPYYSRVYSDVLQRNIARLDAAFQGHNDAYKY